MAAGRLKGMLLFAASIPLAIIIISPPVIYSREKKADPIIMMKHPVQLQDSGVREEEQRIIKSLRRQWKFLSAQIAFSPSNTQWTLDTIQFIGGETALIQFEDGHEVHTAIIDYHGSVYRFAKVFRSQPDFTLSEWRKLVSEFGNPQHAATTYTYDSGAALFTKSSTNVFVRD